ncbi:MAG: hypothetical protein E7218_03040 [Anaerofustis stercorihominis]|nr:hypothetical protein [Anaerofustis stercorihominis]
MASCTFFGHRDTPEDISQRLEEVLTELILDYGVNKFYVGNQGNFDRTVKGTLQKLKEKYRFIDYSVVLAYKPRSPEKSGSENDCDTVYPDFLRRVPYRAAIIKRNEWMIKKSDYVVTYVEKNTGGAARFKELAEKKGKKVINII